ncbi:Mov34/MPN/PAD-1 family protein [Methylomonas sp. MO1]|uniref:Mov34/MPN/PAD-1 family protein n=1 Tax=Methylomonas sp. MO1 TaxID=3073619 RepID=UPI0028A348CC|nr:Mov34/MPN/PAD-1 family protein [Methylomonas sp. MO1]MDT4291615.1 Mov34/MPN/PAD-1 family protein [Methylomonas sp. MO1]
MWKHPFNPDSKILIEENVLNIFDRYRQNSPEKPESGGILLGYRRNYHIHIVDATAPQLHDRRSLFQFFRKDQLHQKYATKRWLNSGETVDYLGEWHTHPEQYPSPSILDKTEWRKIIQSQVNPMIFLIVGTHRDIWLGVGKGDNLLQASNILDF